MQLLFCTLLVICLLVFVSYAFLRYADLPVNIISKKSGAFESSATVTNSGKAGSGQKDVETTLELSVGFPVYIMAILSFFGWFMFVLFGSIGLAALPIDLIMDFINRPKIRKGTDVMQTKTLLKNTTSDLIKVGEELKGFFYMK